MSESGLEIEEWRKIAEYPLYDVSNFGRVRSWVSPGGGAPGKRGGRTMLKEPRILKMRTTLGYKLVVFSDGRGGVSRVFNVGDLVLTAFVGPRPSGMEVCHFPENDGQNNRLDNLRWGTPVENQAHKLIHGTTNRGERMGWSRMTRAKIINARILAELGATRAACAEWFGVSPATICRAVAGIGHFFDDSESRAT